MQIIEQQLTPKSPQKKSEDGILVTSDFIAVIDGSTSKTDRRYSRLSSNGRYAMQIVSRTLAGSPKNITMPQFCRRATLAVRKQYTPLLGANLLPRLTLHPEERLAASAVVYSRLRREVWMIGDCQCLVNGELYDNPKPYEDELAGLRAAEARRLLAAGATTDQLRAHDSAREVIIPRMLETMQDQNKTYAVIDGFDIPLGCVRVLPLSFAPFEIVLASDGYPELRPTLAESEAALSRLLTDDPLCIGTFKATKGVAIGNNSFDDRSYIRFKV